MTEEFLLGRLLLLWHVMRISDKLFSENEASKILSELSVKGIAHKVALFFCTNYN